MENLEQLHGTEHDISKESCTALITEGLSSSDLPKVSEAEVVVNGCLYDKSSKLYGLLSGSELSLILVDAVGHVSDGFHSVYFESMGEMVSRNHLFGMVMRRVAEHKMHSEEDIDEGSTDDAVLTVLREFSTSESLPKEDILFSELINKIKYKGDRLPSFYYDMINFISGSVLSYEQRDQLLSEIYRQFEDMGCVDVLVPVIFDILELSLGPVNNVRLPSSTTKSGLISVEVIVSDHVKGIHIPGNSLNIFKSYINSIREYIKKVAPEVLQQDGSIDPFISDISEDDKKTVLNLKDIIDHLQGILSRISSANIITY